jgi:hypothetical protein
MQTTGPVYPVEAPASLTREEIQMMIQSELVKQFPAPLMTEQSARAMITTSTGTLSTGLTNLITTHKHESADELTMKTRAMELRIATKLQDHERQQERNYFTRQAHGTFLRESTLEQGKWRSGVVEENNKWRDEVFTELGNELEAKLDARLNPVLELVKENNHKVRVCQVNVKVAIEQNVRTGVFSIFGSACYRDLWKRGCATFRRVFWRCRELFCVPCSNFVSRGKS